MNNDKFMGLRIRWWRMHKQRMAINLWGSGLNGGGCMNENQFMGLQIRFDGGGCSKSAMQSIRGAPDSEVQDV